MKHTPGPWNVEDDLTVRVKEWQHCQQMGDHQGCIICDLKPALGVSDANSKAREHARGETEANARLIAAAPSLLAACEALLASYYSSDDSFGRAVEDVRAAVAKAKGES